VTRYFLDTNVCIALLNGNPPVVRRRFLQARRRGSEVVTSTIVAFELWYGVAKSARREANQERLAIFFAGAIARVTFDEEDAQIAGEIRAVLEKNGCSIGAYDLLIAAQALRCSGTLVTANVAEFARVPGLTWVDWTAPVPSKK